MKVTVIKDKESVIYNGKIYGKGDSFDADDLIAKSLIERGYVSASSSEEEGEAVVHTGTLDESQIKEMSYPELKKLAAEMGLDASGKKDELIARICATEIGVEADAVVDPEGEESSDEMPNTDMPE